MLRNTPSLPPPTTMPVRLFGNGVHIAEVRWHGHGRGRGSGVAPQWTWFTTGVFGDEGFHCCNYELRNSLTLALFHWLDKCGPH